MRYTRIEKGETYQLDGHKRRWKCVLITGGTDPLAVFESKGGHELRLPVRRAAKRAELCHVYA